MKVVSSCEKQKKKNFNGFSIFVHTAHTYWEKPTIIMREMFFEKIAFMFGIHKHTANVSSPKESKILMNTFRTSTLKCSKIENRSSNRKVSDFTLDWNSAFYFLFLQRFRVLCRHALLSGIVTVCASPEKKLFFELIFHSILRHIWPERVKLGTSTRKTWKFDFKCSFCRVFKHTQHVWCVIKTDPPSTSVNGKKIKKKWRRPLARCLILRHVERFKMFSKAIKYSKII